jgi:hypothetical protein
MSQSTTTQVNDVAQRDARDSAASGSAASGSAARAARHPALALAALLGAMFLANVDVAIANIAAPAIRAGLLVLPLVLGQDEGWPVYLQQGPGKSAAYSGLALVSWVAAFGIPEPVLGTLYLTLVHHPSQAVHGLAVVCLALAGLALLAAAMGGRTVRIPRSVMATSGSYQHE